MSDILKSTGMAMPTVLGTLFTVPTATTAIFLSGNVNNSAEESINLTLIVTKNAGGSVSIVNSLPIASKESYTFPAKLILEPGDILTGFSSAIGGLLYVNYVEHGDVIVDVTEAHTDAISAGISAASALTSANTVTASAATIAIDVITTGEDAASTTTSAAAALVSEQNAAASASSALTSKDTAVLSATSANNDAITATTEASTATTKAAEAVVSATNANDSAIAAAASAEVSGVRVAIGEPVSATLDSVIVGGTNTTLSVVGSVGVKQLQIDVEGGGIGEYIGTSIAISDDGTALENDVGGFTRNIGLGAGAGRSVTSGTLNSFMAWESGRYCTVGTHSIGIGAQALFGNSTSKLTGSHNTGIGYQTGYNLSTGQYNFLGGYQAGYSLTTTSNNVMIGYKAGQYVAGYDNIGIGKEALGFADTGATLTAYGNVGIGYRAGHSLVSGRENVIVGQSSGYFATTGHYNTLVGGYRAGATVTTGDNLTCVGSNAEPSSPTASNEITLGDDVVTRFRVPGLGIDWTEAPSGGGIGSFIGTSIAISSDGTALANDDGTENNNVGIGYQAGNEITTGAQNVFTGYQSGKYNTSASRNTGIGRDALYGNVTSKLTGSDNTGIGYQTGFSLSTGQYNFLGGYQAGYSLTSGDDNICIGKGSGYQVTAGIRNVYLGLDAGRYVSSDNNVAIGEQALNGKYLWSSGAYNVGIGKGAGYEIQDGAYNVYAGYQPGYYITSGSNNIALGYKALNGDVTAKATGSYNIGIGKEVAQNITTGQYNFLGGYQAGYLLTTGSDNILSGNQAGYNLAENSNNVCIGRFAGRYNSFNSGAYIGDNSIAIGHHTYITASGEMSLGNSVYITSAYTAVAFSTRSDERQKDFVEMDLGLDFINSLEPKKYTWNTGADQTTINYGFSAQQTRKCLDSAGVEPNTKMHIIRGEDPDAEQNLTYTEFISPAIKAIQELSAMVQELKSEINILKGI